MSLCGKLREILQAVAGCGELAEENERLKAAKTALEAEIAEAEQLATQIKEGLGL